jgi:putative phosphoribosyl transferase
VTFLDSEGMQRSHGVLAWMVRDMAIRIPAGRAVLNADLSVPLGARSIIVFAHGGGSGRHSPRNRQVAEILNGSGFATLLADLLTEEEDVIDRETRRLRFDIPLLADRLMFIAQWLENAPALSGLRIGYFGASTGAGAALIAAARQPENVMAIVSRGGRPDLAGDFLAMVKVPVLLIVGGDDRDVLLLNNQALEQLNPESRLEIVPGATHLFEEPGTLEEAARLAREWFEKYEV